MKPNTLSELSKPPHERDPRVLRAEEAAHEARERAIEAHADKLSDTRSMKDFIFDYGDVLARKQALGTAVHVAAELYDRNTLDWDTVHEEVMPYLAAWIRFRDETGFAPTRIEQRVWSSLYGYAGTLDRCGILQDKQILLDLKTSATFPPSVGPQLAAYANALKESHGVTGLRRHALLLRPDGTYLLSSVYTDPADFAVFQSCLNIFNFKRNRK